MAPMEHAPVDPRIVIAAARMRAEGFTPAEHYIAGDILAMGSVEKNPDGSQRAVVSTDGTTTTIDRHTSWVEA